ncbi:MAG: DUF262 domain-containing protein [Cytophagales bacterium]|nr:DUF262 domain-containing protein [Cytophagales bacterium]
MANKVIPFPMDVEEVFRGTPYCIDFYQRDYKWEKGQVEELLYDVFFKFEEGYEVAKKSDNSDPLVGMRFYYLNTFVTHKTGSNVYLMDGQQRLTTLLLIFMVLYRIAKDVSGDPKKWKNLYDTLGSHISIITTEGKKFPIRHDRPDAKCLEGEEFFPHEQTLQDLLDGKADKINLKSLEEKAKKRGTTSVSIVRNYLIILYYLSDKFQEGKDENRLESFIHYFQKGVSLTRLEVETEDAPMIFEAINDKGIKLLPYEVLKGKLLGKITDEKEMHYYLDIWEKCIKDMVGYDINPDEFFKTLFIGRYVSTLYDYQENRSSQVYHREFLLREKDPKRPGLITKEEEVKDFLKRDILFYTGLFTYIKDNSDNFPFFSDTPPTWRFLFGAIHSRKYDPDVFDQKDSKDLEDIRMRIRALSFEKKRLEVLRTSQGIEIDPETAIYNLTHAIRELNGEWPPTKIREIFDKRLKESLEKSDVQNKDLIYSDKRFEIDNNHNTRLQFLRDVDIFLHAQTNLNPDVMKDKIYGRGGWQLEHTLAISERNMEHFGEDNFWSLREDLACQVPLRKTMNRDSSNESPEKKLRRYHESDSIWTATLASKFQGKSKNSALAAFKEEKFGKYNFEDLKSYDRLDRESIEEFKRERKNILCRITRIMWAENTLDNEGYSEIAIYPGHPGSKQNPRK